MEGVGIETDAGGRVVVVTPFEEALMTDSYAGLLVFADDVDGQ